jgi:hypothetical protein
MCEWCAVCCMWMAVVLLVLLCWCMATLITAWSEFSSEEIFVAQALFVGGPQLCLRPPPPTMV